VIRKQLVDLTRAFAWPAPFKRAVKRASKSGKSTKNPEITIKLMNEKQYKYTRILKHTVKNKWQKTQLIISDHF
jgi:hypothetical protein